MSNILKFALLVLCCSFAVNAFADRVDAVWKCDLHDGKEMSDVHAANSEWVKHVNAALDVGEITSGTSVAVVGDQGHFYFVDSYPSLAAWSAVQEYVDSDQGKAAMESIQGAFEDLFDCSSNTLYRHTTN